MPEVTELGLLLEKIEADGMIVRRVTVPVHEVVFVKSVLEAYPGLAAVHAERGPSTLHSVKGQSVKGTASLVVATTPELAGELDGVLHELAVLPTS